MQRNIPTYKYILCRAEKPVRIQLNRVTRTRNSRIHSRYLAIDVPRLVGRLRTAINLQNSMELKTSMGLTQAKKRLSVQWMSIEHSLLCRQQRHRRWLIRIHKKRWSVVRIFIRMSDSMCSILASCWHFSSARTIPFWMLYMDLTRNHTKHDVVDVDRVSSQLDCSRVRSV